MPRVRVGATCLLLSLGVGLAVAEEAAHARVDQSPPRMPLTADDFFRIQSVTDPVVSPDGRWVAYVVTTNERQADEARSAIWMVSWDGTEHVMLTTPAEGTAKPRWSPDGRYVSYLATVAGSEKSQLMLLDRRGGEPRPLAGAQGDIGGYAWSPDGRQLVVSLSPDDGEDLVKSPKPIEIDSLHFKTDEDGYLPAGRKRHLYLVAVGGHARAPLTEDSAFEEDLPAWSPDGAQIAFVRTRERGADPDGRSDIDVMDARPGAVLRTVIRPYAPNAQRLAWDPKGGSVAFLQGKEPRLNAYMQDRLFLVPVAGGASRALSDQLDRAVMSYAFTADSALIVAVEDDGSQYPARIGLANGAVTRQGPAAPHVFSAVSAAAGHVAGLDATDGTADEVYALEDGRLRKLTGHNDALLAERQLGQVEDVRFKSRDGTEVHGLLVKPPSFQPGRRYPTLLWIHGGPNGQDQHAFEFDAYQFEPQFFAARGYVVLRINYRGSSGRGAAFAETIAADWGHKEVDDLLAGIDQEVALGIADPTRLAIGGWSYGGILTDYTIARDRRFKAAVSGAGSGNQLTTFGTDQYILQYTHELTAPWQDTALWLKLSYPFFHADRIRTPTLFLGGAKDFNVPISGGEQMYQALKVLGVPASLVVYPGEHHVFTRPSFAKDLADRMAAWLDRFIPAGDVRPSS